MGNLILSDAITCREGWLISSLVVWHVGIFWATFSSSQGDSAALGWGDTALEEEPAHHRDHFVFGRSCNVHALNNNLPVMNASYSSALTKQIAKDNISQICRYRAVPVSQLGICRVNTKSWRNSTLTLRKITENRERSSAGHSVITRRDTYSCSRKRSRRSPSWRVNLPVSGCPVKLGVWLCVVWERHFLCSHSQVVCASSASWEVPFYWWFSEASLWNLFKSALCFCLGHRNSKKTQHLKACPVSEVVESVFNF